MNSEDLKGIIHSDPEVMGGTPVFLGARVPLQNLIDSLEGGESIDDFLDGFPSVKREQVIAVIEAGRLRMQVQPVQQIACYAVGNLAILQGASEAAISSAILSE